MLRDELLQAVERLEIVAKEAVDDELAGQYASVFKGRGMDFEGVREYQPGDDVRVVDWNVSARMNELHVKQFVEERQLTVFLLVDASGSQTFGTHTHRKQRAAAEIAALVAFSAIENNDRVGLSMFTDDVETFVSPGTGRKHVLRLLREILEFEPASPNTDVGEALEHFARITRDRAVVFIISDFLDLGFERRLSVARERHELVPVVVSDPMERELPEMGVVRCRDPESGEIVTVDTLSSAAREAYRQKMADQAERRRNLFLRHDLDTIDVSTDGDHVESIVEFFEHRSRHTT